MKIRRIVLICLASFLSLILFNACTEPIPEETSIKDQIKGTWVVDEGEYNGIGIYADKYYIHLNFPKHDSLDTSPLTDEEKIDFFNKMITRAGTYTLKDSLIICNFDYHKNPDQIGNVERILIGEIEGDIQVYKIIGENGQVNYTGQAKRVE